MTTPNKIHRVPEGTITYVLDTNILLHYPNSINSFKEHHVLIPITVLEEMDTFKKGMDERGKNARSFSNILDKLRDKGSLYEGVALDGGGSLSIGWSNIPLEMFSENTPDNKILGLACDTRMELGRDYVVLITNDINLRVKADALDIIAERFESPRLKMSSDELYMGVTTLTVSEDTINSFFTNGETHLDELDIDLYPNQYVILESSVNPKHSALARWNAREDSLVKLCRKATDSHGDVWGAKPLNKEHRFLIDALLNPDIKLVTISGKAGTGKTLMALACALCQVTDKDPIYSKVVVSRPVIPMGKDLGYLPGDLDEKLKPWTQPIFDNLEYLSGGVREASSESKEKNYQFLFDVGMIQVEALMYIRGRSIPFQFIIIDEAQNLSQHEIKTIITRAGEGSKIVLTGDPYQIDNTNLDELNNGLSYTTETFKGEEISAHITLVRGERSELAEIASNLM